MTWYSIELATWKYVKRCHLREKNRKQLFDSGLVSFKTASKNLFHKTGGIIGNKL